MKALGTVAPLRALLSAHGYTQQDHQEGWNLPLKIADPGAVRTGVASDADNVVANAMRELDAWDEIGFRKAHAALSRRHPVQADFVFHALEPTDGPSAVLGVKVFLDRLDVLEKGVGRDATHEGDVAALATLATRGLDKNERARLRALIDVARSVPVVLSEPDPVAQAENARAEDLVALYGWLTEWTEVANAVVARRYDRIALGIAKRRKREVSAPDASEAVTSPSAVVANA